MNRYKAAVIRAVRTMIQTLLAALGTGLVVTDLDWQATAAIVATASLISLLQGLLVALPEVSET